VLSRTRQALEAFDNQHDFERLADDKLASFRSGKGGGWKLLGQTTVNFTADHNVIEVSGGHDDYRRIKFKVTDSPVDI
jgi:hypothetical protein